MGGDPPIHLNTLWKTLFFISLLHFVWGLATRPAKKLGAQKNLNCDFARRPTFFL